MLNRIVQFVIPQRKEHYIRQHLQNVLVKLDGMMMELKSANNAIIHGKNKNKNLMLVHIMLIITTVVMLS